MADQATPPDQALLPVEPVRKVAPWRGRKRVPNPLSAVIHIRCTPAQQAAYEAAAARAGYSIGEYFRTLADGKPSLRAARRPAVEHKEVARLVGLLGNLTSNVNQLARAANTVGFEVAGDDLNRIGDEVRSMRAAVMKALGYGD
jgi:malonyl CoA-acyl carrier protein transacylase